MPCSALVVSPDRCMVDQLRCVLEADHGRRVETVHSYREAELALEQRRYESVFIDFRRATVGDDPTELLQRLGQRGERPIPVIAISDGGYVCDWAAVADMIVSGHIQLPLDRLQLAIDAGWRDYFLLMHDPRWESLRGDSRFMDMMDEVRDDIEAQRAEVGLSDAEGDFLARIDAAIAEFESRTEGG